MDWPLVETYWLLARDLLQPASAGADSSASLAEWLRVVYGDSIPLYPELFVSENCSAAFRGVRITYVQVYKSNTQGICGNLLRLHDRSDRPDSPKFTFTFVRDPMAHFVSGFSEMTHQARRAQRAFDRHPFTGGLPNVPHCRGFSARNASAEQMAAAFVDDFVFGRLGPRCRHMAGTRGYFWELDLHCFPQVAFVRSALAHRHVRNLDFVGRLEELEADWARMGAIFPGWPPYSTRFWMGRQFKEAERFGDGVKMRKAFFISKSNSTRLHRESNAASGNPPRQALEARLQQQPWSLALCLVLLPDFVCFGFPLPDACRAVDLGAFKCPFEIGGTSLALGLPDEEPQHRRANSRPPARARAAPSARASSTRASAPPSVRRSAPAHGVSTSELHARAKERAKERAQAMLSRAREFERTKQHET